MKCPTPKLLKANVVYKFDCLCDINISYIGKTKRHLATRIKEHRSEKSAIGQHLQTCHTCDHNFNENQFKILSTGNSDFDCKIREALLIKSEKPTLNQQLFQNGSTFIQCHICFQRTLFSITLTQRREMGTSACTSAFVSMCYVSEYTRILWNKKSRFLAHL